MYESGYGPLYLSGKDKERFDRLYTKPVEAITNKSTFKTFVVSYSIGTYKYESDVRTSSSQAAILWAEALGATNVSIIREF